MSALAGLLFGAGVPLAARYGPQLAKGGKALWDLGRGLGTTGGREAAQQAAMRGLQRGATYSREHPWKSAGIGGVGGMGAGGMIGGDPDEEEILRGMGIPGGVPGGMPGGVPGGGGPWVHHGTQPDMGGPSNLPSYADRLKAQRNRYLNNMSTIVKHSMILQFQNPGKKNTYMKDAIDLLKVDAKQRNEIELAEMTDEVFKGGKVPMSARTVYRRMLKAGASPAEASQVSGYSLEIEKSEAKTAADMARAQGKASDLYGKDELRLMRLRQVYQTDPQTAITQLVQMIQTGLIKLPEAYTGYKPQSAQDYFRLASEILGGSDMGGAGSIPTPSGDVANIRLD